MTTEQHAREVLTDHNPAQPAKSGNAVSKTVTNGDGSAKPVTLTPAQIAAWNWTVLACAETDSVRRAFIDGYNGEVCDHPRTRLRIAWHTRGQEVRQHLLEQDAEGRR